MFLKNDTIKLRALEPEDLDLLYKWENDTTLWTVSSTVEPYSRYILKEYIAYSDKTIYEKKQLRLMIERNEDKMPLGLIDLYDFDAINQKAGVGILIDEIFRGQHYSTLALNLLTEYAFNYLHLHQLFAFVPEDNEPSKQLFSTADFDESGILHDWIRKNDKFVNVTIFQRINSQAAKILE